MAEYTVLCLKCRLPILATRISYAFKGMDGRSGGNLGPAGSDSDKGGGDLILDGCNGSGGGIAGGRPRGTKDLTRGAMYFFMMIEIDFGISSSLPALFGATESLLSCFEDSPVT